MIRRITQFILLLFFLVAAVSGFGQVCGTPGLDGPVDIKGQVNTYYPPSVTPLQLTAGSNSVMLGAVPADVTFAGGVNTYTKGQINIGDLLLIIQMQDATINSDNSELYGSGNITSGADGLGGTGYTGLGNTGKFEYVVATSAVPITGGLLTFKGFGTNRGLVNDYYNIDYNSTDLTRGQRRFQIVKAPQYSDIRLIGTIEAPPFNGKVGGIIAFDVTGSMDMNNQIIDASARGFRGGFVFTQTSASGCSTIFTEPSGTTHSTYNETSGKGEGIVGSALNMWDGFNQVSAGVEGLPNGSFGRGAPGNAGGGGNAHNAGGGGGGNGGEGGRGGKGIYCDATSPFNGGRPGSAIVQTDASRLIMGGGGGAGEVNNAPKGDSGGVGGGIVLINIGKMVGTGTIQANGGDGQSTGWCAQPPYNDPRCVLIDGAAGGGAGGTIFLKTTTSNPSSKLALLTQGGAGGKASTEGAEHGPGGGGGGGVIYYSAGAAGQIYANTSGGVKGTTTDGNSSNEAMPGKNGTATTLTNLPSYLQGGGSVCYPELTIHLSEANTGSQNVRLENSPVTYLLTLSNKAGVGGAVGVKADLILPAEIAYVSASIVYKGGASGPTIINNQGTSQRPLFGSFLIPAEGEVFITINALVKCVTVTKLYNASAQAFYLDPTRTRLDPSREISPLTNFFGSPISQITYTNYEVGQSVGGTNYAGDVSKDEDVMVLAPTVSAGPDLVIAKTGSASIQATASFPNPLTYKWTPSLYLSDDTALNPTVLQPKSSIVYQLAATTQSGCTVFSYMTVRNPVVVPNVFTPNGDGIEDTWVIDGIDGYPNCVVRIFNRWGDLLFLSNGYSQPWDGTYIGLSLPTATYYYVIDLKNGSPMLGGYVAIVK